MEIFLWLTIMFQIVMLFIFDKYHKQEVKIQKKLSVIRFCELIVDKLAEKQDTDLDVTCLMDVFKEFIEKLENEDD